MKTNKTNISIIKDYLYGVRPVIVSGYKAPTPVIKDGESWVDSAGNKKIKQGGFLSTVNEKTNLNRSIISSEKSKCGQVNKWGTPADQKFYSKTGMCYDCVITLETKLRALGIYDLYEKYKLTSNELTFIKMLKEKIQESIDYLTNDDGKLEVLCNGEGFIEKFVGKNDSGLLEVAKKDLIEADSRIKLLEKEYKKLKRY